MTSHELVARTAAVWGSTVVGVRSLRVGESLRLGSASGLPKPEGCHAVDEPLRADKNAWQLDTRGVKGGILAVGGQAQDPTCVSSLAVAEGDHGLLSYGDYSLFFQVTRESPALRGKLRLEASVFLALLFATLVVIGGLGLIRSLTSPAPLAKPVELENRATLAKRLSLQLQPVPSTAEPRENKPLDPAQETETEELDYSAAVMTFAPAATSSSVEPVSVRLLGAALEGIDNGLSEQRIHRIVSLHRTGFSECQVMRETTTVIKFSVAASGTLASAVISETTPGSTAFPRCVLWRFKQLGFPASHAPTNATYRFASH